MSQEAKKLENIEDRKNEEEGLIEKRRKTDKKESIEEERIESIEHTYGQDREDIKYSEARNYIHMRQRIQSKQRKLKMRTQKKKQD